MDKSQLEPDLIQVFRLYIAFRLILVGLTSLVALVRPRVQVEPGTFFSLVELTLLLIYLSIPWFHNKLGRWFLPLALAAATLGPIVEVTLGLQRPLLARTTGTAPAADVWQVTVLLTIPLFLVAWQYSFDAVVGFTAGVAILEFSFNVARALLFGQDALLRSLGAILLRSAIFLLEGAVVTRLMAGQRQQRQVLQDANRQLARYASTMEQLAASRERNRLARELHDTLAHTLSALAVQLEGASTLLDTEPETARTMIQQSTGIARNGLTEVRRAIQALRATPLEHLGLALALRGAAEATAEQTGAELSLDLDTNLLLSPEVEQTIFRIAEEALNNIARHASASRIEVRLSRDTAGAVTLSIGDNGRGFDPSTARAGHFGLRGIQERVAGLGGTLVLTSQPGSGTNILVKFRGDA
ncbi:MAG: Sensor histidine kinase LiaS [Chloroflexi bacterium ADurb.Bin222]|nr:MAG: Sensor histidine kinase LiaS [Chloroflexi bacterium ADurb.Bin222]